MTTKFKKPENLELLHDIADPDDTSRANRLCVVISDVHFTDGTVGNQSVEEPTWDGFFKEVESFCVDYAIEELTLVLDGDVVDMIRTGKWAEKGIYPWQRDHDEFAPILRTIIHDISTIHGGEHDSGRRRFFSLLKDLPERLKGKGQEGKDIAVKTLALLGNHDKEILADNDVLTVFYENCLGQKVADLPEDYRRWVGRQYGDENLFLDKSSVPWLPFYHGDRGFRLFITHGQWRDAANCREIGGWTVKDGWSLENWQQSRFAPFREPCFGDTVAAGVLSTFIYKTKQALNKLKTGEPNTEIARLERIIDELDLYRPTYAAVERILLETRDRRTKGKSTQITGIIENNLHEAILQWINLDFTLESASGTLRWALHIAKWVLNIFESLPGSGHRIELEAVYWVLRLIAGLQNLLGNKKGKLSRKDMVKFPCFLEEYRDYGFHIHCEGHTHIPLQQEVYFKKPEKNKNYTYVNFGAWRDQLDKKQNIGYRRRGVGRAFYILDLKPGASDPSQRRFAYHVKEILSWGDHLDRL